MLDGKMRWNLWWQSQDRVLVHTRHLPWMRACRPVAWSGLCFRLPG